MLPQIVATFFCNYRMMFSEQNIYYVKVASEMTGNEKKSAYPPITIFYGHQKEPASHFHAILYLARFVVLENTTRTELLKGTFMKCAGPRIAETS